MCLRPRVVGRALWRSSAKAATSTDAALGKRFLGGVLLSLVSFNQLSTRASLDPLGRQLVGCTEQKLRRPSFSASDPSGDHGRVIVRRPPILIALVLLAVFAGSTSLEAGSVDARVTSAKIVFVSRRRVGV